MSTTANPETNKVMFCENGPQRSSVSIAEKLEKAREFKTKGNELYKGKNYKTAAGKYHRALLFLKGIDEDTKSRSNLLGVDLKPNSSALPEVTAEVTNLKVDCYNNLAVCMLQQTESSYERIVEHCNKVIELSPKNVKAWFRKGQAYYKWKDFDKSLNSFKEAQRLSVDPDPGIARYIIHCEKELEKYRIQEKEVYRSMFKENVSRNLEK